jgi:glycosyltransferase involved in cell wall biosynthesis
VCVGTLHEVKGQAHLLRACRQLHDADGLGRCTLVGEGPDRAALARLADELGLGERVVFAGACPSDVVAAHLRDADALVAPSVPTRQGKREGIPVVLMEAMATGVPVVASRLSGIPELVEHDRSGLLVPPGDADALAGALLRLRDDADLVARLVAGGRAAVEDEFDLDRNVERLAALLRASAGGSP